MWLHPTWDMIPQELSSLTLQLGFTAQNYGHFKRENSGIFQRKLNITGAENLLSITGMFLWELLFISVAYLHVRSESTLSHPCLVLSVPEGPVRDGIRHTPAMCPSWIVYYKCRKLQRSNFAPDLCLSPVFLLLFFLPTSNLYFHIYIMFPLKRL